MMSNICPLAHFGVLNSPEDISISVRKGPFAEMSLCDILIEHIDSLGER
jgi:hypothetical protein